jgi:hypothetical protein
VIMVRYPGDKYDFFQPLIFVKNGTAFRKEVLSPSRKIHIKKEVCNVAR